MAVSENGTIAEIKFDMDSSPIVQGNYQFTFFQNSKVLKKSAIFH